MVGGGRGGMQLVLCIAIISAGLTAAGGEAAATSVVLGMAQCPSCSRKNMNAEAAFKGLKVAIKCSKGSAGEYESKAVGDLDGTGAFAVPLPAEVDLSQCVAQLHSAASSAPCPGQEPSKIVPLLSEGGDGSTFVAVAGKATATRSVSTTAAPECASANICFPCRVFGRKPFYMHRRMKPFPDYGMPSPDYGMPTPDYGMPSPGYYPSPVYGTPAPRCMCRPTPEPGCMCPAAPVYGTPMPDYYPPPTPVYGTPTPDCPPQAPEYGTPRCMCSPTPEAGCQCPAAAYPTPVYGTPAPRCMCSPTPEPGCQCPYSTPTPVYGTPALRCLCTPTPDPGCQCPAPVSAPVYGTPVYGTPPAPGYGAAPESGTPSYTSPAHH